MALAEVEAASRARQASPPPASAPGSRGPSLPYFPALDGVRGLAVAGVLLFHAGFDWMVGGYLGVSTFFTLSGFLITSLLLAERAAHGEVKLKAFWVRRFRRLMPAALACLVLALVFGVFVADAIQRENLAGDVIASLAYVANWRFIFSGQSYADLFAAGESPVLHFWSLAIEEQFYLLYPLLIAVLVGFSSWAKRSQSDRRKFWFHEVGRRYRLLVGMALVALTAGSLALTIFGGFSTDHIYFGTGTRASELLIGGILAVVLFNVRVTRRLGRKGRAQRGLVLLGLASLIGSIAVWSSTPQSSSWLYDGGFTLYAVMSAFLITAAILPTGPVAWLLALGPIRHLGRISYGVYLYHWPVFLTLRQEAELDQWRLLLIGGAITLVLAELSFHFLEMPIRRGQKLLRIRPIRFAPFAAVGIAVGAVALTITAPAPIVDFGNAQDRLDALAAESESLPSTTIDPAALVAPTPRVAVFGDSTAMMTGVGVASYLSESGYGINVGGEQGLGCSVMRTAQRRAADGAIQGTVEDCNDWERIWKERVDTGQPNISVVQVGQWEILDRKIPGEDVWRSPGDPVFDDYLFSEMTTAVDVLSSNGGIVVWLTNPIPGERFSLREPDSNVGERMARFNQLVEQLPAARPGKVAVVDLAAWVGGLTPEEDFRIRPDGVHFQAVPVDTSTEVARTFLWPAILEVWTELWTANREEELSAGPPIAVALLGDATADAIGEGLAAWGGSGRRFDVTNSALASCGLIGGGSRINRNDPEPVPAQCQDFQRQSFDALYSSSADIVVLHTSHWDVTDRQFAGDPEWRSPGDPIFDQQLRDALARSSDFLRQEGAEHVVWLLTPHIDVGRIPGQPSLEFRASESARVDRLNELIREMAASRDFVTVLDYAAFARSWPGGEFDAALRPDGVTPNAEGARGIANWLGPQLAELAPAPSTSSPAPGG